MLSTMYVFSAMTELPTYKIFANEELSDFPSSSQSSPRFLASLMSSLKHVGGVTNKDTSTSVGSYNNLVDANNQMSFVDALEKTLWPEGIIMKANSYDGPDGKYLPENLKVLKADANPSQVPFSTKRRVVVPEEKQEVLRTFKIFFS